MIVNTNQMISISEANQNFSKATKLADSLGSVVILRNNKPEYMLISLVDHSNVILSDDEKIDVVARRILDRHRKAFEELEKPNSHSKNNAPGSGA